MIKILYKARLFPLVCILMATALISSCKKDKDELSGRVVLLSFGPTGAKHGEQIIFVGKNLNKVTAIELAGATVPAASFTEQTAERIVFVIPQSTEQGYATLKTPEGDVMSKTKVNFEVPVKITSMTAQARPGDNITIKGEYMNWIKEVRFSKDIAETSFVSKSLTQLVVKVPANAQSGTLFISTGGTEPMTIETDSILIVTLPAITSFGPSPIDRGTNLTITGTDLDLAMGVLFQGLTAPITSFVSQSPTQIVVTVPAAANKGKITLVARSLLTVQSTQTLLFIGDLPPLAPLAYAFYVDDLQNGWQNWGWSSTVDFANTENVRDGTASIKVAYSDWGALKFANGSLSTTPFTELTFSIYGTTGTGGKKINVTPNGGKTFTVVIDEGKWVEYKVTMAQLNLSSGATVTDVAFQNEGWSGVVYVDQVGWR
ncbi:MAG: IPT/TIG domain-containing protein [Ferruginibacter sp.]